MVFLATSYESLLCAARVVSHKKNELVALSVWLPLPYPFLRNLKMDNVGVPAVDYEREKIGLEREKVQLERDSVKLERVKARWVAISIIVPLVVAAGTVAFGIWSQKQQAGNQLQIQNQQARYESDLQVQQARDQFALKAAEIVMNAEGPLQAKNKARALANLFSDRLPSNFAESFDPASYTSENQSVTQESQRKKISEESHSGGGGNPNFEKHMGERKRKPGTKWHR